MLYFKQEISSQERTEHMPELLPQLIDGIIIMGRTTYNPINCICRFMKEIDDKSDLIRILKIKEKAKELKMCIGEETYFFIFDADTIQKESDTPTVIVERKNGKQAGMITGDVLICKEDDDGHIIPMAREEQLRIFSSVSTYYSPIEEVIQPVITATIPASK